MKIKLRNNSGVTLIEILIGILISVVMMGAMFTSYTVVNNTYSQVTDRAKISTAGRDVVGMIMRDIRNAGFQYFNDNIQTTNEHSPITKYTNFSQCDKIDVVYGDVNYKKNRTPEYIYERYKITYKCKPSTIPDKTLPKLGGGGYPPIDAFAVYKSKVKWNATSNRWDNSSTDNNDKTYDDQLVVDYVVDMIFNPVDEKGKLISPPPSPTNINKDLLYKIKTVDIGLTVRSTKDFFRNSKIRNVLALMDTKRNKTKNDKYLRDTIIVTAHARNLGAQ